MNVGDYVRFYNRSWTEIGQIAGEVEDSHLKVVKCRDGFYDLDNFIKSSPNIIDLIEVGDYVNGQLVKHIAYFEGVEEPIKKLIFADEYHLIPTEVCEQNEIKSIVTKEQFENMEYKVGE